MELQNILIARDLFWVGNDNLPARIGRYEIISKRITENICDLYIAHEKVIREDGMKASEYGKLLHYLHRPKSKTHTIKNDMGSVIGRVNKHVTIIKVSVNSDVSSIFEKCGKSVIVCWDVTSITDASCVGNIIKDYNLQFSYNIHFACMNETGKRRGVIRVYAFYER